MAIDTAEKRRSAAGIPQTALFGLTPNLAKDREWREQSAWGYSGIASTPPAPITPKPEVQEIQISVRMTI